MSVFVSASALCGCENKDNVLDLETSGEELELEGNRDTGAVDMEAEWLTSLNSKSDKLPNSFIK